MDLPPTLVFHGLCRLFKESVWLFSLRDLFKVTQVMSLPNEVGSEQLVDFLVEGLAPSAFIFLDFLLYRLDLRVNRESMAHNGWNNS